MSDLSIHVINNEAQQRFEAQVPGTEALGLAYYRVVRDSVVFTHTEVPEALEGQGVASALIHSALESVKAEGRTVVPMCPFVAAYIARHPEYRSLVQPGVRAAFGA